MSEKVRQVLRYLWQCREAIIWIAALTALALTEPTLHHYTLCPIDNLGFSFCPGCGLGRSIALFFRGAWSDSFRMHPLGPVAVLLLLYRSISIFRKNYKYHKNLKILNYG
jgi:hypothetical protein